MADVIERMLASRRLERVAVNREHALSVVATAELHVRTARILAGTDDHAMAFTAAYDGARKALTAVLASEGVRVRPGRWSTPQHGDRGRGPCRGPGAGGVRLDAAVRNATEYPDDKRPTATEQDVGEGIDAASAIVDACARYVRSGA